MTPRAADASRGSRTVRAANVALVVGGLALVISVILPRLHRKAFAERVEAAASDATAIRDLALRFRKEHGSLPGSAARGVAPNEFDMLRNDTLPFNRPGYALQWNRWYRVRQPAVPRELPEEADTLPSPPPILEEFGGVTVFADDLHLLAALRERFGDISTVRSGSWTLFVPPQ